MLDILSGESWEEEYGYGTSSIDRRRAKGMSVGLLFTDKLGDRSVKRSYNISQPEDFRLVCVLQSFNG